MWQIFIGRLKKNDVSIGPKLELITAYQLGFFVKLLWKCCECIIILIFFEPKFLWFSS